MYLEELNEINFPDYSKFTDINDAYSDFIGKVSLTIDKIAPMKEIRIRNSSKKWFDEEILEEIEKRDKLLAKFKKSRQPSDSQNYKIAHNKVQGMIKKKQKNFGTKQLLHKGKSLNIRYGDTEIKQHTKVTYLECILDNDLLESPWLQRY